MKLRRSIPIMASKLLIQIICESVLVIRRGQYTPSFIFVETRRWKPERFRSKVDVWVPQARNLCNARIGSTYDEIFNERCRKSPYKPWSTSEQYSWSVISGSRNTNAESRLVRHTTFGAIRIQTKLVIKQQHCVLHGQGKVHTHWLRALMFPVHTEVNQAEGTASLRSWSFVSWRQHLWWAHYIDRSAHPFRIFWLTMATPTHSSNTIWYVAIFFNSSTYFY